MCVYDVSIIFINIWIGLSASDCHSLLNDQGNPLHLLLCAVISSVSSSCFHLILLSQIHLPQVFFIDSIRAPWEFKCGLLFSLDLFPRPAAILSVVHSREWTLFNKVFFWLHLYCCVLELGPVITSWQKWFLYKKKEETKSIIITVQVIFGRKMRVYSHQQKNTAVMTCRICLVCALFCMSKFPGSPFYLCNIVKINSILKIVGKKITLHAFSTSASHSRAVRISLA